MKHIEFSFRDPVIIYPTVRDSFQLATRGSEKIEPVIKEARLDVSEKVYAYFFYRGYLFYINRSREDYNQFVVSEISTGRKITGLSCPSVEAVLRAFAYKFNDHDKHSFQQEISRWKLNVTLIELINYSIL